MNGQNQQIQWHRIPGPVVDLFRRLKAQEHSDGTWQGSEVISRVNEWLDEHGVAPETPADQIPEADDPPHRYQRMVMVDIRSHIELDEGDLDEAVRGAVIGTGIRVEYADTCELAWTELDGGTVYRPGDLAATTREWARRRVELAIREDTDQPPTTSELQANDDRAAQVASQLARVLGFLR